MCHQHAVGSRAFVRDDSMMRAKMSNASPTFSYGNAPTPNSFLPIACGPTSMKPPSHSRSRNWNSTRGNAASVQCRQWSCRLLHREQRLMITFSYEVRHRFQFDVTVRNSNRRADQYSIVFSHL